MTDVTTLLFEPITHSKSAVESAMLDESEGQVAQAAHVRPRIVVAPVVPLGDLGRE